jgi:hypothetical protein
MGIRHSGTMFLRMPVADTVLRRVGENERGEGHCELDVDASNGETLCDSGVIVYNPRKWGNDSEEGLLKPFGFLPPSLYTGARPNASPSSASSGLVQTPISALVPAISMLGVSGKGDSTGEMR